MKNRVNADRIVTVSRGLNGSGMMLALMHACRHLCANSGRGSKCGGLACGRQAFQFFSARTGRLPRSTPDQYSLAEVDALTPRLVIVKDCALVWEPRRLPKWPRASDSGR